MRDPPYAGAGAGGVLAGIVTRAGGPGSAAGRPAAHSFHSVSLVLRGLAVGGGAYGSIFVATASLVGLATILYFKENTNKSEAEEGEDEVRKKVPARDAVKEPYLSKEAAIEAGFVDKDGKIMWSSYLSYVELGVTLRDSEAFSKKARDYQEAIKKQEVKVDEATMKARFQDWMKEYGRSYSTEEEKARRYGIFKEAAVWADKVNALEPRTIPYGPNGYADFTDEEFKQMHSHCAAFDWESYIDELNTMAARGWTYFRDPDATNVSEAAKKKQREMAAKRAEISRQAANINMAR